MQNGYLYDQFLDLNLMLLVLDVQVVEHLLLLSLGKVRVGVFVVKFLFERSCFFVLFLQQPDQILILIDEMSVLSE